MSSNAEDTPKTTLTSLPTELITRIVRLSSPKPSWDNSVERSAHLRNLALVCRTLRGPAQEELFRHVVLPSVAASRAFVAVLKSRAGARFASTPRSLRAGVGGDDWIGQDKLALPFIVKRCSRLESLWLFEVDALDVARLVSGTVVKELYCVGCTLCAALRDRKLEAPALVRLGLSTCENLGYLDPGCFPKLKSLDTSIFDLDPSEIIDLIAFLNSLGGQLSSLGTDCQDVGVPKIQSELFTSLRVLDIGLPLDDLPPFLNSIPSHIRHLRAQMWPLEDLHLTEYGWADKLITEHLGEDQYPCLKKLEHFRFPSDANGRKLVGAPVLEAQLAALRPEVRISFDDEHTRKGDNPDGPVDLCFNPAFWALVDDAEAEEEERRRLEGI